VIEIRLEVDKGSAANATRFFSAGQKLVDALDSLAENPTEWVLTELRLGSGIAALAPDSGGDDRPILRLVGGLGAVGRGEVPSDWPPDTYTETRALIDASTGEGAVPTLTLVGDTSPVVLQLDDHLAKRLAQSQPTTKTIPGSLRGTVTGVNVSRGNRASLRLQGGRTVRVKFPDSLRQTFREALYGLVEAVGEIKQDAHGLPFHLAASEVRLIPETPTRWSDLLGVDPRATDGLPVLDYLRRSRGES